MSPRLGLAFPFRRIPELQENFGRTPGKFQQNSMRIPAELHENSRRIPEELQENSRRTPVEFRDNSSRIPGELQGNSRSPGKLQEIPEFQENSRGIQGVRQHWDCVTSEL